MTSPFDGEVMPGAETHERPSATLLIERLKRVLDADAILSQAACRRYTVRGHVPSVVATPANVEDVSAVLAVASELGAAVVPWGSGSRMAIGLPPRRCDVVLSLERLRRVLEYDPADLTLSVQAGASHAELRRTLATARQMLPLDVPLEERATLGGTLATGTAGLRRTFYGGPRDLVLGMRVVDAQGTVLKTGGRVVKNVTGYDMSKLYIGALGTLGVIVEANLKLTPLPEAEGTMLGVFRRAGDALAAAELLDALGVRPSALAVVQVGALPELANLAPDHLEHALLAARFPGAPPAVARALREGEAALRKGRANMVLAIEGEAQNTFWAALDDYVQCAIRRDDEMLLRIWAQPTECSALLETVQAHATEHALAFTWLIDAAAGTIWLRVRPDRGDDQIGSMATMADALESLRQKLRQHRRAPSILDAPEALAARVTGWADSPATQGIMREIKQRFDPDGLLNPGRFS